MSGGVPCSTGVSRGNHGDTRGVKHLAGTLNTRAVEHTVQAHDYGGVRRIDFINEKDRLGYSTAVDMLDSLDCLSDRAGTELSRTLGEDVRPRQVLKVRRELTSHVEDGDATTCGNLPHDRGLASTGRSGEEHVLANRQAEHNHPDYPP